MAARKKKGSKSTAKAKRTGRRLDPKVRKRIKEMWKKKGMTIRAIAEKVGVAPSTAYRVSRGT